MPRRVICALALLAMTFGMGACGEADDTGGDHGGLTVLSAKSLATVADKTTASDGMRMSMQQTMTIAGTGTIPMTAEGIIDNKHRRGEMTMQMDLSSLPDAGALGGGDMTQHIIFDGLTFYMCSPLFTHGLGAGKRWVKFDLAKLGKQAGIDLGALMQGGGQDPTQSLQYLKAASGDVKKVGTETVRGEPTTHYTATVDFRKVADAAPADQRKAVRKAMGQITGLTGTTEAPMEIWVGDDGVLRRLTSTVRANTSGERMVMTQRMEFYDFGTKIDVKIPPARQTVDIGDLGAGGDVRLG